MRKIPLQFQIVIALFLGLIFSIVSIKLHIPHSLVIKYVKPFGDIFLNSLKAISIPLVVVSLIVGITSIEDTSKLSRISSKTLSLFFITTIFSAILGIIIVNTIKPGKIIPKHTRRKLMKLYGDESTKTNMQAIEAKKSTLGPLQIIVNIIPSNIFQALTNTKNLLQVVFISIIFGLGLIKIPSRKRQRVVSFFEGCNEALIEIIKLIMKFSPIGIFALISSLLIEITSGGNTSGEIFEVLKGLLWYMGTVLLGLFILTFIFFPIILKIFTKVNYQDFLHGMKPAQLVAFTTSSSSAALPVTMERVERHLGVSEEISSFVLPLGSTVNMNGSSLYQAVSIIFITQVLGIHLSLYSQALLVINVTMASIGAAGIPGASLVAVSILLESMGIPAAGLSLIFAPERLLDMCKTVTNITGDAAVAVVVASTEGELSKGADEYLLKQDNY